MSRYNGSLMDTLVHSAVAGAGLSMGRDVYRKTRDNILFIVLAVIALAGTAYGFWNMSRGHDRGPLGTIFRTFLANAFIIALSFSVFMFAVLVMAGGESRNGQPLQEPSTSVILGGLVVQAALALAGVGFGFYQRGRRVRAIQIDRDNARFLDVNGFRDVGGKDQTMLDPSGEELVLEDFRSDAIVFKVRGRRSVRAKIMLDATGRMVSYVPALF